MIMSEVARDVPSARALAMAWTFLIVDVTRLSSMAIVLCRTRMLVRLLGLPVRETGEASTGASEKSIRKLLGSTVQKRR